VSTSELATPCQEDTIARIDGDGFHANVVISPLNQRIQVLGFEARDAEALVGSLIKGARAAGFGKVFLKAPLHQRAGFEQAGMTAEATINGYFAGQPAVVMSLFLDRERLQRPRAGEEEAILDAIKARPADPSVPKLPGDLQMRRARPDDADELAELYRTVFASYPFPITEPEYLISTMKSHVVYRIVRNGEGAVVAAASAETDDRHRNAEMTDFATLPDQRGLGLAQHILAALEHDMAERAILNLYTIARARSAGMSRVFYNRGYEWTGTLVNNCHISGEFEDMHVWCKSLADIVD
jgi:putative beta-lysine N-acetyltransferase